MENQADISSYIGKWAEQPAGYTTRDLILYAVGIGCTELRYIYENDGDFAAFPTFPLVLNFTGLEEDVVSFPSEAMTLGPKMPPLDGVRFVLDGERYLEQLNPLPTEGSMELTIKSRLIGVHKRGSGASVEVESILFSKENGTEYVRMIGGSFMVGATGFKDAGKSFSEKITVPGREPDAIEELKTSPYQAQIYRLSGDYNPLHVDPEMAKMNGFKEPILHGLCTLGFSTRAVIKRYCGNDPELFKSVKLRFKKPVIPGNTLQVEMWKMPNNRIIFQTKVKETGKVVVGNAYVDLKGAAAKL